jgi:acyl carrier protein
MFRTGDIGWRNGKGDLFFSHRAGQNQKFKGEWLELTSVAQAVSHHPDVSQAAALLTSDDAPELICYYVAQQPVSAQELRKTAAQHIGGNALPDRFFALDALPQTPSGKCDLKALAARPLAQKTAQATPASHAGAVTGDADATKTEQRLTAIWKHALNLEQLTRFDDFFDLGGDSLSIVRMLLDVEEAFHIRIPHARLPRVSTIAQLAVLIAELKKQAPALKRDTAKTQTQANPAHGAKMHDTPALEDLCRNVLFAANRWGGTQVGQSLPIRAFHETGKKPPIIWCFNDTFEPARMAQELGPDQPLYALRSLNGILESRDKKRALASRIAARYADEIQTLSLKGPLFIGGNCQAGAIAENLARLFLTRGADLAMLALLEHTPTVAYPAKLALFYGATSRAYNPFLTMEAPEIMWEHMHNDVVWDIISGDHGEYFTPAHLPEFIKKLKRRMEACDALTSL